MRWAKLNPGMVTLAATHVLNKAEHDGKTLLLSVLTGHTITLPPATGSGNKIRLVETVAPTSATTVIKVANATDVMIGQARTALATGVGTTFPTVAASDTITLNRTTSGGASNGEQIVFEDVKAGFWAVNAMLNGSGVLVTPFSATV